MIEQFITAFCRNSPAAGPGTDDQRQILPLPRAPPESGAFRFDRARPNHSAPLTSCPSRWPDIPEVYCKPVARRRRHTRRRKGIKPAPRWRRSHRSNLKPNSERSPRQPSTSGPSKEAGLFQGLFYNRMMLFSQTRERQSDAAGNQAHALQRPLDRDRIGFDEQVAMQTGQA